MPDNVFVRRSKWPPKTLLPQLRTGSMIADQNHVLRRWKRRTDAASGTRLCWSEIEERGFPIRKNEIRYDRVSRSAILRRGLSNINKGGGVAKSIARVCSVASVRKRTRQNTRLGDAEIAIRKVPRSYGALIAPSRLQIPLMWRLGLVIALFAYAVFPARAMANDPGAGSDADAVNIQGLKEIVVTAQKTRQNINDVGMSIVALSGNQLQDMGISGPADLGKVVPGFTFTRSNYGPPVYTLRGVGFNDTSISASPAVSVYLNQVPLPFSAMARGVDLDIKRVEVLKGPQGTLYGQNATGGAINYIPNEPSREFNAGGDITYSSYNHVIADGAVTGPVSDDIQARAAISVDQGGAWQKSETRNATNGASRFVNGRLLVNWEPSETAAIQFNLNGWVDHSDELAAQAIALYPGIRPSPALTALQNVFNSYPFPSNPRQADWDPQPIFGANDFQNGTQHQGFRLDDSFLQGSVLAHDDIGHGTTLTSITAWERLTHDGLADLDGLDINDFNIAPHAKITTISQELRLNGRSGPLMWLAGANFELDRIPEYDAAYYSKTPTYPSPINSVIKNTRIRTLAAFAHLDYAVTESVDIPVGIRYTNVHIHNSACLADGGDGLTSNFVAAHFHAPNAGPGNCVTLNSQTLQPGMVDSELDQSNVPWSVGVNWKIAPRSLLYASVSRGFKAGSFSPIGAFFSSQFDPATQESVLAYETGFKLDLADNRVQLNGAVFYYDYLNKQIRGKVVVEGIGLLSKIINIPKSRIDGGELQLAWAPDEHWMFNVGANYTDSRITNTFFTTSGALGVYEDMHGEVLPFTPKVQLTGDAEYDMSLNPELSGFVGGHATYQSLSYGGLGEETIMRIDGYSDFDLRVGVKAADGRWSVSAFVNNVADHYSWNSVGSGSTEVFTRYANLPRIFGIRVTGWYK